MVLYAFALSSQNPLAAKYDNLWLPLEDLRWPKTKPFEYQKNMKDVKDIKKFDLAIAYSDPVREEGLMRKNIQDHQGMVFIFNPQAKNMPCFWMKNTPQDLTLIFLDQKGKVLQKEIMKAQTTDLHCAKQPIFYAVELTVKAGQSIDLNGNFKPIK